ncbi:DGQHR domain-containing protein, partial [Escherichia coli]
DTALLKYAADIESYKQRTAVPMINIVEKLKALGDGEPQFRASVLASREGLSRYLAGAEG